ncbi:hypothetical protein J7I84_08705 [Arthrobacter sp. ISL-85]|uniref:hypothetical protein n=1 Tax=Arthrobacter sp. ISL-85 TaxID=2819115 RepID=UPI001BE7FF9A|nr:hypothetical protein [Arthrobacter sp. ISL-85]MBT2566571.1 hypothetical protein [Arthrobacter sp. ISL-85]
MEYKRSAGVYVGAISLLFAGPLLAVGGGYFTSWAALRNDSGLVAIFIAVMVLGSVVSFVGILMLIVSMHRALVKIDALPVRTQSGQRQEWHADQYREG